MADVFISYARQDAAIARRVAKALEGAGLDVWWDADLPAHRAYSEVIERNLDEAKAVVVVWSATAAKSQWVRAEADFARNAGKLVQGQIDGTMPPMPFNQIQCADLKGWRGAESHAGWAKLRDSAEALVSGEERAVPACPTRLWDRIKPYRTPLAAALALLLAAGIYFYAFGVPGEQHKPVLAVLPFKSLDAQDESLVAGMWEDTRSAIGRNPQLIVLGPNTAEALAGKGEGAAKRAADYLLEASVRTAGDRIRVSANLVRTHDGAQLWSQDFDRNLDDVFALQSQIASEIEGRIRGRLAERGGITPEHIATSGEVYALYSDARAKIRKRNDGDYQAAQSELLRVVRTDPNFAPGWAALADVGKMVLPHLNNWQLTTNSERFARKAIDLAPNLASAHAALARSLDLTGPVARAEIERSVELDPSDYEALNWLAGMRAATGDKKGALESYSRAAEIEPLFWPAVLNKFELLKELRDQAGIEQLIEQERKIGADYFIALIGIDSALEKQNLAGATNIALQFFVTGKQEGRSVVGGKLWPLLLQLGFIDEALKLGPAPDFGPFLVRNDPRGLDILEAGHIPVLSFFALEPLTENAGRVYLLSGRSAKLSQLYLSLGMSPGEVSKLADARHFILSAPLVALALKRNGHGKDADALLALAEREAKDAMRNPTPENSALLARVYAAEGRASDALPLLASAVRRGWLPPVPDIQNDLRSDPPLAILDADRRFEALRQQILGSIARERAQVNLSLLRQATTA